VHIIIAKKSYYVYCLEKTNLRTLRKQGIVFAVEKHCVPVRTSAFLFVKLYGQRYRWLDTVMHRQFVMEKLTAFLG